MAFFAGVGSDVLAAHLSALVATATTIAVHRIRNRRYVRLADFWSQSQGIATSAELREFVDSMPAESRATLDRRLGLEPVAADTLLYCLGYEVNKFTGRWELSNGGKARKRRKRWIEHEGMYYL